MPASGNTDFGLATRQSVCRTFGASSSTEAGFAWCGGSRACREAGVHSVLLTYWSRRKHSYTAHFCPIHDLP